MCTHRRLRTELDAQPPGGWPVKGAGNKSAATVPVERMRAISVLSAHAGMSQFADLPLANLCEWLSQAVTAGALVADLISRARGVDARCMTRALWIVRTPKTCEKRCAETRDKQGVGRSLTKRPAPPGARAPGETQAYLAPKTTVTDRIPLHTLLHLAPKTTVTDRIPLHTLLHLAGNARFSAMHIIQKVFDVVRRLQRLAITRHPRNRPVVGAVFGAGVGMAIVSGAGALIAAAAWLIVAACVSINAVVEIATTSIRLIKRQALAIARANVRWVAAAVRAVVHTMDFLLFVQSGKTSRARRSQHPPMQYVGHRTLAHHCITARIVPAPISRA